MSGRVLTLRAPVALLTDGRPLQPERLLGLPPAELARLPLRVGNRDEPLAELFTIAPTTDAALVLVGDLRSFRDLGAGMTSGHLLVDGAAGDRLGCELRGGTIEVRGSVGDLVGAAMAEGVVRVDGDAGDGAGGALPGSRAGMTGGLLQIRGRAGDLAGDRMRRGILLAGGAGHGAAARMLAGTMVITGPIGDDGGLAMRRGTLLLAHPPPLPATFADNGTLELPWLRLLARHLARRGVTTPLPGPRVRRLTGCASAEGKGEILIAA